MEARGSGGHRALAVATGDCRGGVAAGAATFLLRPRSGIIDPAAVDAKSYFTAVQLDRAEDFRVGPAPDRRGRAGARARARWRCWRGGPPRRAIERITRRPILGAAVAGAGISLLLVAVDLPLSAWDHQRAVDVGLSTQNWADWFGDLGKSAAIGAASSTP